MSSSSNLSSKKSRDVVPISLSSLPEDVLVRISSVVAASKNYKHSINLLKVSRIFRRISTDGYVLRSLPASAIRKLMLYHRVKFQKCLDCENNHALFYQGFDHIFRQNERSLGMKFLLRAATLGHEKAIYLVGMILISLGGDDKAEGYDLLSSLQKDLVSDSEKKVMHVSRKVNSMFWRRDKILKEFKESYVREVCQCNGKTTRFLELNGWTRHGWELLSVDACQICFWHHEVGKFYKYHLNVKIN